MSKRKTTSEKWFGRLMRLLPEEFRSEYGREMGLVFRDRYREESMRRKPNGIWKLWWETLLDIVRTAPREHWDLLRQDARSATRAMRRNLGFTLCAVVTLGLGIGANIGVFSLVDGLLLQSPPHASERVRVFGASAHSAFSTISYPNYRDLRDRNRSFASLAAHRQIPLSLSTGELPEQVPGELVSGNYFATMEVTPAMGRLLDEQDDLRTSRPVAVISYGLWQRRFGGGPQALESEIRLFGKPFHIVGIAPREFPGSYAITPTQVWVPLALHQQVRATGLELDRRGWGWLTATGRLREGVGLRKAQSEIDVLGSQLAIEHPRFNRDRGYRLYPAGTFPESVQKGARGVLGALLLVSLLVLLLVLANLSGVLLARALQRRRDMAIRRALGATRTHVVRLWLTESLLMSLFGGVAGIVVALATRRALWAMFASDMGAMELALPSFGLGRILGFGLIVTALSALTLGLLPAWRAGRESLSPVLNEEAATTSRSRRSSRIQAGLSIAQVVVSVVLVAASGLLLRSVRHAESFQPGFETANLWAAHLNLSPYGYDSTRGREFFRQLEERLEARPEIDAVTIGQVLPLSGEQESMGFRIEDHESAKSGKPVSLDVNLVGADYFSTMGIPILEGRDFESSDSNSGSPLVVVVSETLAKRFWPGGSALGKHLDQGPGTPQAEVVGVARDIRYQSLGEDPLAIVFGNASQIFTPSLSVHLRVKPTQRFDPRIVSQTVASLDPDVAVGSIQSFDQVLSTALLPQRVLGTATAVFGVLALILTSIGLYALLSHAVQQRRHEFGIRMVMGAQHHQILGLVVRRGLLLALVGVVLGAVASIPVAKSLKGLLFGVGPSDPVSFLLALGLPLVIALVASALPARRAIQVDPAQSIRRL